MANDDKRLNGRDEYTAEELEAKNEKFRTIFSTSVAQVPKKMDRRDDEQQEQLHGLLGMMFRRDKKKPTKEKAGAQSAEPEKPVEMPTGEIRIGGPEDNEPQADLVPGFEPDEDFFVPVDELIPEPEKQPEPTPAEVAEPDPQPAPKAEPKQAEKPRQAAPRTPLEQREDAELAELKAMINTLSQPKPKLAPKAEAPQPPAETPKAEEPKPAPSPVTLVFAEEKAAADVKPVQPVETKQAQPEETDGEVQSTPAARFFGEGDDELKAPTQTEPLGPDDSMDLPLKEKGKADVTSTDAEAPAAPVQTPEEQPAEPSADEQGAPAPAEAEEAVEVEAETETVEPSERFRRMAAELTLRCVLSGILAVVLLHFGLVAEGLLAPMAMLDPIAAPSAFHAANLLVYAAALAVAYPILRDGLEGLRGRPSAETMPALAACGGLIEAAIALINAPTYQPSSFTLLTGVAGLGLFTALLGRRIMLAAIRGGCDLLENAPTCTGAYRVRDKDLIRTLSKDMEQKDPWILLSRPLDWQEVFVEGSLAERASERRARKTSYILLGAAVLSGLAFLVFGGGVNGAAAAMTAMLCMGAPLSSTLIAGLAALRLQRTAEAAGAVVPGWPAIQELGGIDTVQVDADDLFAEDSAQLEDIRIFKGGRIDRAILYAASILNQSCNTLRGLFSQIIEDRTDILYPVKDLEVHRGLGFAAWCDNNRVIIGNRIYLESEGVTMPELDYENEHSKNGELQILYLAVSGSLHAMFVLRCVGSRSVARGLDILKKENIRLLVSCLDPSMTVGHISEAYHLPDGMVTLLDQEQCDALAAKTAPETADAPKSVNEDVCCMMQLRGFTSLTGGLRAAEQAQNAETSATTVQLVSVWFSVAIGVLLTYAGSIGYLSVAAVFMYQAAWTGLSIAICALKQHGER